MPAGIYNFVIEQGATVDFELQYKESNLTPIDLSGYEAAMIIRTTHDGTALATLTSSLGSTYAKASGSAFISLSGSSLAKPLASGSIGIYIGHAVTDAFTFSEALYDIELTKGQARTRLLQGKVKLSKDVT
jgi:hypothetical protein